MYAMGDSAKAQDHFTRTLRADPDHARARTKLKLVKKLTRTKAAGTDAFKARKYPEALALYSEALEIDPTNVTEGSKLFYNRALVHSKMGNHAESLGDCDEALKID